MELGLRSEVVKILKRAGRDPMPVENVCQKGCPDLNFTGGWIEIKKTKEWTRGVVKLDHDLTKEQRIWLRRRARKGGSCWVLVQIDQDFLLLLGPVAADLIGHSTRPELEQAAVGICKGLKELKEKLPIWLP